MEVPFVNVLVIGRGGREHAICMKLKESRLVETVYCAPGSEGIGNSAETVNIQENEQDKLIEFAKKNNVELTIIGPEVPLLEGLADRFSAEGLRVFGPSREAALIEGSKGFAKDLMKRYRIPTADYRTFADYEEAAEYIRVKGVPIVIKADGVAAGKGVCVAFTLEEALDSLAEMMLDKRFGSSADKVVIEEFLQGEEFSFMAFINGETVIPLQIAQDHKRAYDNDLGPNTGGMGAYSPVPQIGEETIAEALETILLPAAAAMVKEGKSFCGVLFAGLIKTEHGPKVIEFNARFGDPETQVVLPRMKSDLAEIILDILEGKVPEIEWHEEAMVGVVLASGGYPEAYENGKIINGLNSLHESTYLFHAGTKAGKGHWITNGGRILLVGSKGNTIAKAQEKVYGEMKKIICSEAFYRKDIANRAIGVTLN
nr:phosphoribosylamine--glycine ligase [Neobacillus terrae]